MKLADRCGTSTHMRALGCLLSAVLAGCWSPLPSVDDDLLPVALSGSASARAGGTGGGTALGGGATGGGTTTMGGGAAGVVVPGVPFNATPLIAPVAGRSCGGLGSVLRAGIPADAGCGNSCLFVVSETSTQLAFRSGQGPAADRLWFAVQGGLGPDFVVFTAFRAASSSRWLVAKSLRSDRLVELQPLGNGNVEVKGLWFQGAFHYVVTEFAPMANAVRTSTLRVWSPTMSSGAEVVANLPAPLTAGFGINSLTASAYLLVLEDGLYQVPLYGMNRQATRAIAVRDVTAFTVTDTGPFAYATRSADGSRSIVTGDFGSTLTTRVLTTQLSATTLGILDFQRLVALDDHGVWVLDREGRELPTLLYAQRHFVQGYRIVSALAVEPFNGSRVFVGEICDFDPDSPGYGTVKLELPSRPGARPSTPGKATWATGSGEWPWRTPVLDPPPWELLVRDGQLGPFLVRVTGP